MEYLNYVRCPTCNRTLTKQMVENYIDYIPRLSSLLQEKQSEYVPFFKRLSEFDFSSLDTSLYDALETIEEEIGDIGHKASYFLYGKLNFNKDNEFEVRQKALDLLKNGFGNKYTPTQAIRLLEKEFGMECCRMRLQTPFRVPMQSSVINTPEGAMGPLLSVKATTTMCVNKSIATPDVKNPIAVMTTTVSNVSATTDLDKNVVNKSSPGLVETTESNVMSDLGCELADLEENLAERIQVQDSIHKELDELDKDQLVSINNTDPQMDVNEQSGRSRFFALTKLAKKSGDKDIRNLTFYNQQIIIDSDTGEKKILRYYRAR